MECELEVEGDSLICERCGKCKMDRLANAELSSEIGLLLQEQDHWKQFSERMDNGCCDGD